VPPRRSGIAVSECTTRGSTTSEPRTQKFFCTAAEVISSLESEGAPCHPLLAGYFEDRDPPAAFLLVGERPVAALPRHRRACRRRTVFHPALPIVRVIAGVRFGAIPALRPAGRGSRWAGDSRPRGLEVRKIALPITAPCKRRLRPARGPPSRQRAQSAPEVRSPAPPQVAGLRHTFPAP